MPFGVIVLAAGGSARLGQPKQLLPYQGATLIEHAVRTALETGADQVAVVVGAGASVIQEVLLGQAVKVVKNDDWQTGMASSIHAGIRSLSEEVGTVVVMLVDQPLVTANHLKQLLNRQLNTGAEIVASSYEGVLGVPAVFARSIFPALVSLEGDRGARDLIRQGSPESVEFQAAAGDVDTIAMYEALANVDSAP